MAAVGASLVCLPKADAGEARGCWGGQGGWGLSAMCLLFAQLCVA